MASYHTTVGRYAVGTSFASAGVDNAPLHALQGGVDGPNGVYRYGPGGVYPTDTFGSSNYLVDVVFDTTVGPDTTAPTITSTVARVQRFGRRRDANVTATFSEPVTGVSGTTFELRDASNALVPATVTYDASTRQRRSSIQRIRLTRVFDLHGQA